MELRIALVFGDILHAFSARQRHGNLTGHHMDERCFGSYKFDDVVIHEGVGEYRSVGARCDDLSFAANDRSNDSLGGDSVHFGRILAKEFLHVVQRCLRGYICCRIGGLKPMGQEMCCI
jgi:hypothetical protein